MISPSSAIWGIRFQQRRPGVEASYIWGMCGVVEDCQRILYRSLGSGASKLLRPWRKDLKMRSCLSSTPNHSSWRTLLLG